MAGKSITFQVQIDFDLDGSYTTVQSTALGVTDDVSRFVKSIDITLGNNKPDDVVAAVGNCTIRLDNTTRYFSPANTKSPLYGKLTPNKPVLVKATDGVNSWTRFAGFTLDFVPTSGEKIARECTITCTDYLGKLQAYQLSMPILTSRTGDVLAKVIVNAVVTPKYHKVLVYDTVAPSDGDYVVINGTTFTFRNTISAANDVLIDSTFRSREVSFENLRKAINGEGGSGTLYHASTTRPDYVIAAMHNSHYQVAINDSPTRYYRLGETGGTTAYDYGTNGANGTYNGSPTLGASGAVSLLYDADKAVTLDGTNDYVSLPTLEFYGRSFTVEFWFKPAASPSVSQDLFSVHSAFSNDQSFFIRYNDGAAGIVSAYFYGTIQVDSAVLVAGTWYHIAATYDSISTTLTLYMDGVAVDTATGGPFVGVSPTIQLGWYSAAGASTTKGDMDDAKIYLSCLSATAIALHQGTNKAFGVLITSLLPGSIGAITTSASGLTLSNILVTALDAIPTVTTYETGVETFDYAGDNWGDERTNALSAITEVTQSEQGWFYQDIDGLLYWRNRDYPFTRYAATVSAAFNNDALPQGGTMVERIKNRIVVNYRPRGTVSSGVVAMAKNTITVPGTAADRGSEAHLNTKVVGNDRELIKLGANTKTVDLDYRDATTGAKMAVTSLTVPPAASTDWTAGEQTSGDNNGFYNNFNYLNFLVQNLGTKARVTITNTATGALKIFNFQLRGVGLAKYDQTQIIREDTTSIDAYARRVMSVNLPLPVTQAYAEALSEYLLNRYSSPAFEIEKISFGNRVSVDGYNVYSLHIGDVITITDEQLGITALKHQIVGMSSTISVDSSQNNLEMVLRRVDDTVYGVWDSSTAGIWDSSKWSI